MTHESRGAIGGGGRDDLQLVMAGHFCCLRRQESQTGNAVKKLGGSHRMEA